MHGFSIISAGFCFRVIQVVIESSLYVLIGFLTAGTLRVLIGPEWVRRFFGTGRLTAPLRAWLAATALLPVCALGVLPVLRELRRAGVPRHAVLTFALSAPMLNPISLISGISYLGPNILALLIFGTFLVSVGAGVFIGPAPEGPAEEGGALEVSPASVDGSRRLIATLVLSARMATGPALGDIAVGLVGAGVMATVLTPGYLAESMFADDGWAIVRMTAIAPLTYVTPDMEITTIPEMLKFRQSAGALFVLATLGVGLTLGHLRWAVLAYGPRPAILWLSAVVGMTSAGAYTFQGMTIPVGTANADNDHFNEFANPFEHSSGDRQVLGAFSRLAGQFAPHQWATCAALASLIASGLILRASGSRGQYETYLAPAPSDCAVPASSIWNRPISTRLVSTVGSCGLLAVAGVGIFAYFPSPDETFENLSIIKADFFGELGQPSLDPAKHHLELWERQVSRLRIGSLIRLGPSGAEPSRATQELHESLETLRKLLEAGRREDARSLSFRVGKLQNLCRELYRSR